jgi:hypothetical protein
MNPFSSGHTLSSFRPSEQVTARVRPALNLLELRASIPPLVVLHPALVGDECARPASFTDGFERSRHLLNRLEVLAAALQQVEELGRGAADAPFWQPILLNKILRAIVDHVPLSPDIDPTRPDVREVQRTDCAVARKCVAWNTVTKP